MGLTSFGKKTDGYGILSCDECGKAGCIFCCARRSLRERTPRALERLGRLLAEQSYAELDVARLQSRRSTQKGPDWGSILVAKLPVGDVSASVRAPSRNSLDL